MQIDLHKPILDKNDRLAEENRELFCEKKVFVLDLLASPGSGKTSTMNSTSRSSKVTSLLRSIPRRSRARESLRCRSTPVAHAIWKAR